MYQKMFSKDCLQIPFPVGNTTQEILLTHMVWIHFINAGSIIVLLKGHIFLLAVTLKIGINRY